MKFVYIRTNIYWSFTKSQKQIKCHILGDCFYCSRLEVVSFLALGLKVQTLNNKTPYHRLWSCALHLQRLLNITHVFFAVDSAASAMVLCELSSPVKWAK